MKKKVFLLVFFNCIYGKMQGQNLVPNPGFTTYTLCPTSQNQLIRAFPWVNPNTASSDYYHSCSGGVPNGMPVFYQADHTGLGGGFAAIGAFTSYLSSSQNREYVQVRLIDSLKQASRYCVDFYVSLTEESAFAISDIGVYISDSAIFYNGPTHLSVIPQIENPVSNMLTDMVNWMKVSGIYLAHGGEQNITIGNFRDSASSHAQLVNSLGYLLAYYLIDDVSVINCDSLFIDVNEINLNVATTIYPNPTKEELTIDFSGYALEDVHVRVLNMMGCEMISAKNKWANKIKLNTAALETGLYIAEIRSKNGIVAKKFLKE